jgi:TATA-box binding protein (TBP) (component of TFIID and TFIIIB)
MTTFNRNLTDLNISTLVYMLDTNIVIDPDKLEKIFTDLEPISYSNPIDGVIKISVRGKTKGLCKKLVFRRSYTQSNQVKNFRNQVSFYVRIIDQMPIYIKQVPFDMEVGFFPRNEDFSTLIGKNIFRFRKGQTAFQFKKITIQFDKDVNVGDNINLFTSVTRKSQESQLKCINYKLTEKDIDSGYTSFDFPTGCYAHTLYINCDMKIQVDIDFVVEVNMFMFTSGKIKIAGCTQEPQIDRAMDVLMNYMENHLGKNTMRELFGKDKDEFRIKSKNPVMINSDFAGTYEIKRYELDTLIRDKYNVMSSFEPCTHPAVIIKYYHNSAYNDGNGTCLCTNYFNKPHKCTGRGNGKEAGECKTVTILVFQSGKVILTGGRHLDQVNSGYKFIQNVLQENEKELRRVHLCGLLK